MVACKVEVLLFVLAVSTHSPPLQALLRAHLKVERLIGYRFPDIGDLRQAIILEKIPINWTLARNTAVASQNPGSVEACVNNAMVNGWMDVPMMKVSILLYLDMLADTVISSGTMDRSMASKSKVNSPLHLALSRMKKLHPLLELDLIPRGKCRLHLAPSYTRSQLHRLPQ